MHFDKNGEYIKTWCPELKDVPTEYIHSPWKMPFELQKKINLWIGIHYPKPIACEKYTPKQYPTPKADQ